MFKKLKFAIALVGSVLLAGCGGGGGDAPASNSPTSSSPVSYTAAATVGELVTYTVDESALTYSYKIEESQYGQAGQTGSGTLTALGNHGYSLSGISNSRIQVLPNGLLLGVIRNNFGSGLQTVPVMGISNPVTNLADVAGTYNYLGRACVGTSCSNTFGTIQVNSVGTWSYCYLANQAGCSNSGGGTLTALGGGKFAAYDGIQRVGTAFAMKSSVSGQNVLLIDLTDPRTSAASVGRGMVVASTQVGINTAQTNGSWIAVGSDGNYATFNTSGGTVSYTSLNGSAFSSTQTISLESPWTGMGTTSRGIAMLAGYGVYVYGQPNGYLEIGLKYN